MRNWVLAAVLVVASTGAGLAQDVEAGEGVFKRMCFPCHDAGPGAKIKLGPPLNGLDGRTGRHPPGLQLFRCQQELRHHLERRDVRGIHQESDAADAGHAHGLRRRRATRRTSPTCGPSSSSSTRAATRSRTATPPERGRPARTRPALQALSSRARSRSDDQGPGRQSRRGRDAATSPPTTRSRWRKAYGAHVVGVAFVYEPVIPGSLLGGIPDRPDRGPARGERQGRQGRGRQLRGRRQERRRVGRDAAARRQHRRRVRPVRTDRAALRHRGGRAGAARTGRLRGAPDRGRAVRVGPSGHRRAADPDAAAQARPRDGLLGRQPPGRARHRRRHAVPRSAPRRSRSWS